MNDIWVAHFADAQLIIKKTKEFIFLLCIIDVFCKYAWVIALKDKKILRLLLHFEKLWKNQAVNQTKYWLENINKVNRSIKLWSENNDIEIYSTHKEGKSVAASRFIRTLDNKIYKYMTAIWKSM